MGLSEQKRTVPPELLPAPRQQGAVLWLPGSGSPIGPEACGARGPHREGSPETLVLEASLGLFPSINSTSATVSVESELAVPLGAAGLLARRLKNLLLKRLPSLATLASPLAASLLPFWASAPLALGFGSMRR